jgi:hypothetical protein
MDDAKARIGGCASVFIALLLATTDVAGGAVTLAWDPVVHLSLSGCVAYSGPALGNFKTRQVVGDVTTDEFIGLDEGQTCHFAVTAYDIFYD